MNLDERFSAARTELETMFANADVPPADGVRTRHRRRLAARYGAIGLAALTLVFGTAAIVNNREREGVVADDSSTPTTTQLSTTVPQTKDGTMEIVASADLRFDPAVLAVPVGEYQVVLVGGTGTGSHNLVFERDGVLSRPLGVDGPGDRDEGSVRFTEPGEYIFFDTIPGHRAAGMEGRVIVGDNESKASNSMFPPANPNVTHGAETWAVVLAGAFAGYDDVDVGTLPALAPAIDAATAAGYTTGQTTCDMGAAEALGVDPQSGPSPTSSFYTVSVYFRNVAEARQALDAFHAAGFGGGVAAQVETFCLD
jgi:plastocyanin